MADWPFDIADPVRAVHFALERDCPYSNPGECPRETEARRAVEAHQKWLATPTDTPGGPGATDELTPEQQLDAAYRERAHLVAWLAAHYPAVITPASDVEEPGWQIVYLTFGGGQGSWHISPRDADLFARVPHVPADDPRAQWDGHTTDQKYERIRHHTRFLANNFKVAAGNLNSGAGRSTRIDNAVGLRERLAEALRDRLRRAVVPDPSLPRLGQIGVYGGATEYDLADAVLAMRDDELAQARARVVTLEHVAKSNKQHVQHILPDLWAAEAAVARVRALHERDDSNPHTARGAARA